MTVTKGFDRSPTKSFVRSTALARNSPFTPPPVQSAAGIIWGVWNTGIFPPNGINHSIVERSDFGKQTSRLFWLAASDRGGGLGVWGDRGINGCCHVNGILYVSDNFPVADEGGAHVISIFDCSVENSILLETSHAGPMYAPKYLGYINPAITDTIFSIAWNKYAKQFILVIRGSTATPDFPTTSIVVYSRDWDFVRGTNLYLTPANRGFGYYQGFPPPYICAYDANTVMFGELNITTVYDRLINDTDFPAVLSPGFINGINTFPSFVCTGIEADDTYVYLAAHFNLLVQANIFGVNRNINNFVETYVAVPRSYVQPQTDILGPGVLRWDRDGYNYPPLPPYTPYLTNDPFGSIRFIRDISLEYINQ